MAFRDQVARVNRRVINPVMRTVAGRVAAFGVVEHRGRRSGRVYQTPVWALVAGDGFIIALVYGTERDWVRNVRAAGGCSLTRGGHEFRLTEPRLVGETEGLPFMPMPVVAGRVLRVLGVTEFLRLSRADG